jgi:Zn-dependent protease
MLLFDLSVDQLVGIVIALVVGITFHEFSHAAIADSLGDHRPRALGRISLNPMRHIDPMGAVFFLLAGFGWGRPVPVNPSALRPGRIGMAFVAAGGPIANVVVAIVAAVVFRVLELAGATGFVTDLAFWVVLYNLLLALFNLLPIPPLDGSHVVANLLPPRAAYAYRSLGAFGLVIVIVLLMVPGLLGVVFLPAQLATRLVLGAVTSL